MSPHNSFIPVIIRTRTFSRLHPLLLGWKDARTTRSSYLVFSKAPKKVLVYLTLDILRNYRRPILMTDSNPVNSGNKSIQIKSRRHHHPDLELLHPSDRVFYDHSRSIELLIVSRVLNNFNLSLSHFHSLFFDLIRPFFCSLF